MSICRWRAQRLRTGLITHVGDHDEVSLEDVDDRSSALWLTEMWLITEQPRRKQSVS